MQILATGKESFYMFLKKISYQISADLLEIPTWGHRLYSLSVRLWEGQDYSLLWWREDTHLGTANSENTAIGKMVT